MPVSAQCQGYSVSGVTKTGFGWECQAMAMTSMETASTVIWRVTLKLS